MDRASDVPQVGSYDEAFEAGVQHERRRQLRQSSIIAGAISTVGLILVGIGFLVTHLG
ncbi:hypothetical protein [Oceanicella sp. SM1341]|uniref:hypothetical protein n=1 Tax=Oceanicella sp. SM1341 TaxID=1548889 RepID=UPI00130024AC|nr:hypothetical protein [Oceanicella sp. SM1341]